MITIIIIIIIIIIIVISTRIIILVILRLMIMIIVPMLPESESSYCTARCLSVDVASVVWDLFLLDGEARSHPLITG